MFQLNIKGILKNKADYLGKLADNHSVDIIIFQETRTTDDMHCAIRTYIHGYNIVAILHGKAHGIVIYVKNNITDYSIESCANINEIQVICIKIANLIIINIYKPPAAKWSSTNLRCAPYSAIYVGDFNSHHQEWGYKDSDDNSEF